MRKYSYQAMNYPTPNVAEPCISEDAEFYRVYMTMGNKPGQTGIWVADFADEAHAVEFTKEYNREYA